ncbi:MAG: carboxypeptidase-like regulatory domain-containing protein, partial [Bacteroidota bacterium]|nr:carboxypeptidase-like regulatory domain-containing protein [Bacteroidota bacterium]MDX5431772.1 carboxypeptidase-like regulatory domain-containing protein [Bacteroidota bacterium]MDX5470485.1 carboxypeptidase-like regulatory domain-containing protein [Bacteroidota bacterium]
MKKLIIFRCFQFFSFGLSAQNKLTGSVYGLEDGQEKPLAYASLRWMNTSKGTITNGEGKFELERTPETSLLIASYTGFSNDTLETAGLNSVRFLLKTNVELAEAVVKEEKKATSISSISSMKTEVLGKAELKKAACCNLSESFETNPTVEVSFSDALTGIRQIQMLGLSGIYAQTLIENIPMMHGLNASTG